MSFNKRGEVEEGERMSPIFEILLLVIAGLMVLFLIYKKLKLS